MFTVNKWDFTRGCTCDECHKVRSITRTDSYTFSMMDGYDSIYTTTCLACDTKFILGYKWHMIKNFLFRLHMTICFMKAYDKRSGNTKRDLFHMYWKLTNSIPFNGKIINLFDF